MKLNFQKHSRPLSALTAILTILAGFGLVPVSEAQQYPTHAIRMIVPFPPGGGGDIYGRIIAIKLSDVLRQQVVIDNRTGGGGVIGAELLASAAADGYTIGLGQTNNMAISPALRPKNTYDPTRDFACISTLVKGPQAIIVNAASPIVSVKDLIAAAKENPGKLNYGSGGVGSTGHINGEVFNQVAGVNVVHIPYKGAVAGYPDLLNGSITYFASSLPFAVNGVKDGKIRAIATTGPQRARLLPETPTVAESGLPGYEVTSWHILLAPTKVPRDVIVRLNAETVRILGTPEFLKVLQAEGGEVAPSTPAECTAFLRSEITKWAQAVKKAGITVD